MPHSKDSKKRAQNLPALTISQKVTVEDVLEEESDNEYLPGKDIHPQDRWQGDEEIVSRWDNEGFMESDEEDMEDNDEEFDAEIQDEVALLTFEETLQRHMILQQPYRDSKRLAINKGNTTLGIVPTLKRGRLPNSRASRWLEKRYLYQTSSQRRKKNTRRGHLHWV